MGSANSKQDGISGGTAPSKNSSTSTQQARGDTDTRTQQDSVPPRAFNDSTNSSANSDGGGGCPMKRTDGSYSFDWTALFKPQFPHGPAGSKPISEQEARDKVASKQSEENAGSGGGGGCPVRHGGQEQQQHPQYNVYSQRIDPTNNMPANPNQLPAASQMAPLSTERVVSSIPKGGASSQHRQTWTYPSPQMFYNALARKGKLASQVDSDGEDDTAATSTTTREEDMANVVAIHNNMNEKTWQQVVVWETVAAGEPHPQLLKFCGRPTDLSPKARFKHWLLGHPLPYDRHDWTVVRQDGSTARYVIDYYYDETRASTSPDSAMPALDNAAGTPSLLVDVRPALDSPSALWQRAVTMPMAYYSNNNSGANEDDKDTGAATISINKYKPLPLMPTSQMKSQVSSSVEVWRNMQQRDDTGGDDNSGTAQRQQEAEQDEVQITDQEARTLARQFAQVLSDCRQERARLDALPDNNTDDEQYALKSTDLTLCMARTICPLQHTALVKQLESIDGDDATIGVALDRVNECVLHQSKRHVMAKHQHPRHFKK